MITCMIAHMHLLHDELTYHGLPLCLDSWCPVERSWEEELHLVYPRNNLQRHSDAEDSLAQITIP